jgi:hypothetical protein
MAEEPSHMKQLSLIQVCKIGLKGPKREIFDFGVFAQIRPIWIGDLGTRPKNYKFLWFRHENRHFILISAVAYNAKKL